MQNDPLNGLILITIIKLENVTFIPIVFLVTHVQTIKVFYHILCKARQINFLVLNTNFNEDSYPVQLKLKNEAFNCLELLIHYYSN